MVQVFFKKLGGLMRAFVNTGPGLFTLFMVLGVITAKLESDKIANQRSCSQFHNFKCENGGIRMYSKKNGVSCWCPTDYVGEHCQTKKPVSFMSRAVSMFGFGNSDVSSRGPMMWWSIFPFTSGFQLETVYAFHQNAVKRLENVFTGAGDDGNAARILPPACSLECCENDKNLPPLTTLHDKIFKRKPGQFIPDENNRNLLYDACYKYFILQFFDADSNMTVTASQLYGSDPASEISMRSFSGGKLNTLQFNDKHYAPYEAFELSSVASLNAEQKKSISKDGDLTWLSGVKNLLSKSPTRFVLSTLWVREHNRVCDELSLKWVSWTDEELYTTARKIVTGQMMTIMMNEILNVKLRPEVYHHRMENTRGSGTPIEVYLTMALSSLPEKLLFSSTKLMSFIYNRQVLEDTLKNTLNFMASSKMGMVTAHNDGALTEQLTKTLMTLSRDHCVQGFNDYRRLLGLPVYNTFFEMTGNVDTAFELKKLYGTVEKVELLTGVLTEQSSSGAFQKIKSLSNHFIINSILTNEITSKNSWVPETFGGDTFFDLIKSTTLKSLVRRNLDELRVDLYTNRGFAFTPAFNSDNASKHCGNLQRIRVL